MLIATSRLSDASTFGERNDVLGYFLLISPESRTVKCWWIQRKKLGSLLTYQSMVRCSSSCSIHCRIPRTENVSLILRISQKNFYLPLSRFSSCSISSPLSVTFSHIKDVPIHQIHQLSIMSVHCPTENRLQVLCSSVHRCSEPITVSVIVIRQHNVHHFFFVIVNVDLMWGTYLSQTWYHCSGWSSFETIGIGNAVMSAMAHTPPIKYSACLRWPMPHEIRQHNKIGRKRKTKRENKIKERMEWQQHMSEKIKNVTRRN